MRTVVFSDERVARRINEHFVAAWKNVEPQEKFPDGWNSGRSEESLRSYPPGRGAGNITSIFAAPDGTVLTGVTGFLTVDGFLAEAERALRLRERMFDGAFRPKEGAHEVFKSEHREAAESTRDNGVAARAHQQQAREGPLKIEKVTSWTFGLFLAIK